MASNPSNCDAGVHTCSLYNNAGMELTLPAGLTAVPKGLLSLI